MKIKVSAPGKLMLLGEHAVVYGHPCIVTAVDKRLYVEAEVIDSDEDEIIAPQVKESRFVLETITLFKQKYQIKKRVKIRTKGDFSHNVGLGSSSAVTVATFKALSEIFNKKLSLRQIFELSYEVTLKIQGVGSGFDIAAATFGGVLYFTKGGKVIESLEIKSLPLVVGYSGVKADTPLIVRNLKLKMQNEKLKVKIEKNFVLINKLVKSAKKALVNKNWKELGGLMTEDHELLIRLGVSTEKLNIMVKAALVTGAYGAKLSGAGGGDCMIALVSEDKRRNVETAIKKVGGEIIKINNNAEGVRID
ncbi:mevalonate kinase [Candidatus Roizmanbacteria bacterium RIFCSPHIGHO2_01_FULL_39_12c]|uniref:Mevalonate kinase n=1 Tax=Candidatus Roizmanbacteria bacterium RIFCSPHIGHO2_01_FULL_39_12c TaxID=1802031 RepID=A0A1F7GBE0_9BACT|nr:MAG: mevalonate kinase [Candidatus Roizmanbacteria bacterium RIFCSPHIGHO2_01_FULL_39_12c]OGK47873.1 MAG: mevalonate kinase [Candidatus Roizmanbacteria bacterium RIFCSPLOWO2_01_FULL_40_13]